MMEKHINKKIIIAISFVTIMVMAGFTGLMYYNLVEILTDAFAIGLITAAAIKVVDLYGGDVGVYMGYNTGRFNVLYPIFSYNPPPNGYHYVVHCQPVTL